MDRTSGQGAKLLARQTPQRVLVHFDSRAVFMEVETRWGVCSNSPAKWTGSENGWRLGRATDVQPAWTNRVPGRARERGNFGEALGVSLGEIAPLSDPGLVVVAGTQMRSLETDVGKASMRTATGHGWADSES
jgi:hypothetical protein